MSRFDLAPKLQSRDGSLDKGGQIRNGFVEEKKGGGAWNWQRPALTTGQLAPLTGSGLGLYLVGTDLWGMYGSSTATSYLLAITTGTLNRSFNLVGPQTGVNLYDVVLASYADAGTTKAWYKVYIEGEVQGLSVDTGTQFPYGARISLINSGTIYGSGGAGGGRSAIAGGSGGHAINLNGKIVEITNSAGYIWGGGGGGGAGGNVTGTNDTVFTLGGGGGGGGAGIGLLGTGRLGTATDGPKSPKEGPSSGTSAPPGSPPAGSIPSGRRWDGVMSSGVPLLGVDDGSMAACMTAYNPTGAAGGHFACVQVSNVDGNYYMNVGGGTGGDAFRYLATSGITSPYVLIGTYMGCSSGYSGTTGTGCALISPVNGLNGGAGTINTSGSGGAGASAFSSTAGIGGNGGDWGIGGTAGSVAGGTGGAAGKAINLSGGRANFIGGTSSPNLKGTIS